MGTVKKSGSMSWQNRKGTLHGSKNQKALARLNGKAMGRDAKPSGFLSRKPRP